MTYDPKCAALARVFLEDSYTKEGTTSTTSTRERLVAELAEAIQSAIEDFISEKGLE